MAKNQTGNATNDSKNLINQGQGLTAPIMNQFQTSMGTAQGNQASLLSGAQSGFTQQQTTGGYDPGQLSTLRGNEANLASTGGYDPGQLSALQGQMGGTYSGYQNMADTGGFTDKQGQDYVRQATQGTTGTYGVLSNQVAQDKAKTGGLGTGGEISQMARQLGQTQATNTLNAENSLSQMKTANTLSGLGGENATSNQQSALQTNVAGAKASGVAQQAATESNVAAGSNAANVGLSNLFNTETGQITSLGNQILQTLGLNFSTQEAGINALTNLSKNPGTFQTIMTDLIGAGGAAGGIMRAL